MVTLTKKINGSYRSKLKTRTPVNIAITKEQAKYLKLQPRLSLKNIKDGKGSLMDWKNLVFRLKIALEMCKLFYSEDNVKDIQNIFDALQVAAVRYTTTKTISLSTDEYELVESGLDAMDQIQDENTRRDQLDVYKAANAYSEKLLLELKEKVNE